MKPSELLDRYLQSHDVSTLADLLKYNTDNANLKIDGLAGSSHALVASALFKTVARPFVIIVNDRESAAYLFNDIESFLEEKYLPYERRNIFLYPSSYLKPYESTDTDSANVLLRSEVIKRLSSESNNFIVVTYPEALTERIV